MVDKRTELAITFAVLLNAEVRKDHFLSSFVWPRWICEGDGLIIVSDGYEDAIMTWLKRKGYHEQVAQIESTPRE